MAKMSWEFWLAGLEPGARHIKLNIAKALACIHFAVLAVAAPAAWAQGQPTGKFGWDYDCASPVLRDSALCKTNALGTKEMMIYFITEMYSAGQYEALNRGLQNLVETKRRTFAGETSHETIDYAFRRFNPMVAPLVADRWQAATPSSYFVPYLRARAAYSGAWKARGGGPAGSVSAETWTMFYAGLDEAERLLNDAPPELKSLPIWHTLMLAILQDNSKNHARAEQVFNQAIDRWPTNFELYKNRLTRLTPWWGGSWELADSAIRKWSERVKTTEGRSLYARLYIDLISRNNLTPERTAIDWKTMKASFEDLVRLYPKGSFSLRYAAYSCAADDKESFLEALTSARKNGDIDSAEETAWLDGHSFEACMVWAGQCAMDGPCVLHPPRTESSK